MDGRQIELLYIVLPLLHGVFFDTYGEDYDDLRDFHALLPKIMRQGQGSQHALHVSLTTRPVVVQSRAALTTQSV